MSKNTLGLGMQTTCSSMSLMGLGECCYDACASIAAKGHACFLFECPQHVWV